MPDDLQPGHGLTLPPTFAPTNAPTVHPRLTTSSRLILGAPPPVTLGPELIPDPTLTSAAGITLDEGDAPLTIENGQLVGALSPDTGYAKWDFTGQTPGTYRVTFDVVANDSPTGFVLAVLGSVDGLGTERTSPGTYTEDIAVSDMADASFYLRIGGGDEVNQTFADNVSVRKVNP